MYKEKREADVFEAPELSVIHFFTPGDAQRRAHGKGKQRRPLDAAKIWKEWLGWVTTWLHNLCFSFRRWITLHIIYIYIFRFSEHPWVYGRELFTTVSSWTHFDGVIVIFWCWEVFQEPERGVEICPETKRRGLQATNNKRATTSKPTNKHPANINKPEKLNPPRFLD